MGDLAFTEDSLEATAKDTRAGRKDLPLVAHRVEIGTVSKRFKEIELRSV